MQVLGREASRQFEEFIRDQSAWLARRIEFRDIAKHAAQNRLRAEGASDQADDRIVVWLDPSLELEYLEMMAAHEIMEAVLQEIEGFPHGIGPPDLDLGAKLISYVLDPVVDSRIREHGFDPEPRWKKGLEFLRREFSADGFGCPPWSDTKAREIALRYMHAGLLGGDIAQEGQGLIERACPDIAAMGRTLLDLVLRHGYETPELACGALSRLRSVLGLEGLVRIWSQADGRYV